MAKCRQRRPLAAQFRDWPEVLVFGFIVVTGAIMVGSLVRMYLID